MLYNDLQNKGIRCWRWREDAKKGNTLLREIDEAIRQYDKLIEILRMDSLDSPSVVKEIERVLQKEDNLRKMNIGSEVLFPIRLDDSIFSWSHYSKSDIITKRIGDFRSWNDEVKYTEEQNYY